MPARTVTVDRDRCLGSGICVLYAPETFTHDDDAKAVVLDHGGDPLDALLTAVEGCPTRALHVTDADSAATETTATGTTEEGR